MTVATRGSAKREYWTCATALSSWPALLSGCGPLWATAPADPPAGHTSWLNRIELCFSIRQSVALAPNRLPELICAASPRWSC